jgi:hypothetical protein
MNQQVSLRIILESPPANVDFGIQNGKGNDYETIQKQRSVGKDLRFEFAVTVKWNKDGLPNFLGPVVQGPTNERFIYIDIGTYAGEVNSIWSRRLKIPLRGISADTINRLLLNPELKLQAKVPGTGKDGGPSCATVKPFDGWHIS